MNKQTDISTKLQAVLSVDPCTPVRVYGVLVALEGVDPVDGLAILEHLAAMWRTAVDDKLSADAARIGASIDFIQFNQ